LIGFAEEPEIRGRVFESQFSSKMVIVVVLTKALIELYEDFSTKLPLVFQANNNRATLNSLELRDLSIHQTVLRKIFVLVPVQRY
jgi:hypothetical protein